MVPRARVVGDSDGFSRSLTAAAHTRQAPAPRLFCPFTPQPPRLSVRRQTVNSVTAVGECRYHADDEGLMYWWSGVFVFGGRIARRAGGSRRSALATWSRHLCSQRLSPPSGGQCFLPKTVSCLILKILPEVVHQHSLKCPGIPGVQHPTSS